MNKGERAIAREERRLEKERKRRIELANKMLIPTGGKTRESLDLISFDPSGVFRFEGDRWLKVFEIEGAGKSLIDAAEGLFGRIRITFALSENGRETCHLSLMEEGEIYEDVRRKMTEDESKLQGAVKMHALSVDDVMNLVAVNFYQDVRFSYASFVRGKKDWKKECFFDSTEEAASFHVGRLFGESFTVLAFPDDMEEGIFTHIRNLGCPMYVSMDLNCLMEEEKLNFKRELEKKYNRRLSVNETEDYINLSLSITIMCDSNDARQIVEETLISIFLKYGVVIASSFHNQKRVSESAISLGLVDDCLMRNVKADVAKKMMGGDTDGDAKVKIRSDEAE